LGTQVPVPWMNRNTAPSKSKIALEKKYVDPRYSNLPSHRLLLSIYNYKPFDKQFRYYSSLPRDLILRFYDAFRMDFELFDYSINDILVKAGYRTI
jgi:hypothetical protein